MSFSGLFRKCFQTELAGEANRMEHWESDVCLAILSPTARATKTVASTYAVGTASAYEEMPTSEAIGNALPSFAVAVGGFFLALGAFFTVKPARQPRPADTEVLFSEFVC